MVNSIHSHVSVHGAPAAHGQSGSALPIALALLGLLTVLATAVMSTAIANARLAGSLLAAGDAFLLASEATEQAFAYATDNPGSLPDTLAITLPISVTPLNTLSAQPVRTQIALVGNHSTCGTVMAAPVERRDYEIRSTAMAAKGGVSHQRLGFSVCHEICSAPCTGVATLPQRTYWYVTRESR